MVTAAGIFFSASVTLHAGFFDFLKPKPKSAVFEGMGKADPSITNQTQRRALSKRAAITRAQAKAILYIDKLKLDKKRTVKEARLKNKKIQITIDAYIRGVEVTDVRWDKRDNCTVKTRIRPKQLLQQLRN